MTIKNYIGGNIEANSSSIIRVFDPSTGEIIDEVVNSNNIDFNNTIKSSKKGFNEWLSYTPLKRSRILSKYKDIIEKCWVGAKFSNLLSDLLITVARGASDAIRRNE